jgi:hypothetical protein
VGAIYLNSAGTEFQVNDSSGEQAGQIRQTSITINEDGSVGTVQKVDLAV